MLPRSLSFSSDGPTPLRILPARGAGAGPTLQASHLSQLRVYRCSGSLASAPLPCRPGRTPRSVTKICSPVKLHSPSWLCGPDWPTKPAPHTPSCPPAQCGGSRTSRLAHFLIAHSPVHHDLTYSICSRSLPEPHSPVLNCSKSSTPPRKKGSSQPRPNTRVPTSTLNLERSHHTSL